MMVLVYDAFDTEMEKERGALTAHYLPFVLDVGILQVDVTGWENPLGKEIIKLMKC